MDDIGQTRHCFERGTSFRSREELIEALRRWLIECDDATVGDDSVYGGTPWLHFETSAGPAVINADTTRQAVERMIAASPAGGRWWVVANTRGRVNKIVFDRHDSHAGWYAYLRQELPTAREL